MQRHTDSEPLYQEGLAMLRRIYPEAVFPNGHPDTATILNNLAVLYVSGQRFEEARPVLVEALEMASGLLGQILVGVVAVGREGLFQSLSTPDEYTSVACQLERAGLSGAGFGLDAALLFKGLLTEAAVQERSWGVEEGDDGWRLALDKFERLQVERAALEQALQATAEDANIRPRLEAVVAELAEAESDLAKENLLFAREKTLKTATSSEVAAALADNALLLEFVRYDRFDAQSRQYYEARYIAYLLGADWDSPLLVDLGEAAPIDGLIQEWRGMQNLDAATQLEKAEAATVTLNAIGRELYARVIAPIEAVHALPAEAHLIIAPDGELTLLPFEALVSSAPDDAVRYLVEDHPISYVTSGRDIVVWGMSEEPAGAGPALVIGAPDFDLNLLADLDGDMLEQVRAHHKSVLEKGAFLTDRTIAEAIAEDSTEAPAPLALVKTPDAAVMAAGAADCWPGEGWKPLTVFDDMGGQVHKRLAASGLSTGPYASGASALETLVKRNQAPRILVLATHGYACDAEAWVRRLKREHLEYLGQSQEQNSLAPALPVKENPLLQSGLAFAGANRLPALLRARRVESGDRAVLDGLDDGDLTALEVAALNLHGTELVSLIACQTGVGPANSASGVQGLRSAFRIAGAQATQMSLFAVFVSRRNLEARKTDTVQFADGVAFADTFFARWTAGASKLEAHRAAQLALLETSRAANHQYGPYGHPFFWAPFILIGDPN
jgi:CHAT domain-containing protein